MFRHLSLVCAALADRIPQWRQRLCERRMLVALSDRSLHDLGIGRADAWREYGKPFWRN